jgi:integrase
MKIVGRRSPNGTGTIEWRKGKPYARIPLPDGRRPRVRIPQEFTTDERRKDFVAALIEKVRAGKIAFDAPKPRGKAAGPVTTVRELVKAWTDGDLFRLHGRVNGLRKLAGAKINWWTLEKHALKIKTRGARGVEFGALRVVDVTEDDVAEVMAQHADGRHATRQKTYRRLHRVFDLAIFPCKLREEGDNPVTRRLRPVADEDEKLFLFLYPQEVVALLRCKTVPEGRRVLYALAVYTGLRKGSLYRLKWRDIDFENGTLSVLKTKTGAPAFFAVDASLVFLLRLWHERCGRPGGDQGIISGVDCEPRREAQALRADLAAAGIKRAALSSYDPNIEPLRFHDLRATFVTWARRAQMSDAWISERTGHQSDEMIARYTRAAQTLADLRYVPFPDISGAIPELAPLSPPLSPAALPPPTSAASFSSENRPSLETSDLVGASGFEPPTPRPPV